MAEDLILLIYLDCDMISAKGKNDLLPYNPEQQAALEAVYRASDAGQCELRTSDVTGEELAPYRGAAKPTIETIYQSTTKVPYTERQKLTGIHSFGDRYTWINSPMIEDNPLWLSIRALGLKDKDAHHVMLASQGRCNVLLTCDSGVLYRGPQIAQQFGVKVLKPAALCKEMGWK